MDKENRTPDQINADYAELCKLLGDSHAKLHQLERNIDQLHRSIDELDVEMKQAMQRMKEREESVGR
jgi:septal ring factor EnvC (AmiA/AmiB activator)